MYVCLCHGITDHQIRAAVAEGASSLRKVCAQLPVGSGCGRCVQTVQEIVKEQRQMTGPRGALVVPSSCQAA